MNRIKSRTNLRQARRENIHFEEVDTRKRVAISNTHLQIAPGARLYISMNKMNPIYSICNFFRYLATKRLHFPRQRVGEAVYLEGRKWIIFRHAVVDPDKRQPEKPGAIFRPIFHVAGMSIRHNILFSILPIPFYIGLPSFRSKLWMFDPESGDFSGYYEWDSVEDAQNYSRSFAAGFMTRRSLPGSVSFTILPQNT